MNRRAVSVVVLATSLLVSRGAAAAEGWYRDPSLVGDTLVFAAEGDLWRVPLAGGQAMRLTSHPGDESNPAISPDGSRLAFSAEYEGSKEVWIMPLAGGRPERLTWEGERAEVVGWTPDNRVLYRTRHFSTLPQWQLATVDPADGQTTVLPLHQAWEGAYSSNGTLYFTRLPFTASATKRYRGGLMQGIWRWTPGEGEAEPLTGEEDGVCRHAIPGLRSWWTDPRTGIPAFVFVSDRDGVMNLWAMSESGEGARQLTHHAALDVRTPTRSGDIVVYQHGADLRRYDLGSGTDEKIEITLPSDLDQTRTRWVDDPVDYLTAAHLAPDASRVVLTSRGQVFTAPVGPGRLARVTRRDEVRWRDATFLDAQTLIALEDETGELEFATLSPLGLEEPERITNDGARVHRFGAVPSPDGKRIAWTDKDLRLWIRDLDKKRSTQIAESSMDAFDGLTWSPDSRYLAFVERARNDFTHVRLHDTKSGDTFDATTPRTQSGSPAWSPDGKWLWFLSDRDLVSLVQSPWGAYQPEPFLDRTTGIFGLDLAGGQRSPFAPDTELDQGAEAATVDDGKDAKKDKKDDKKKGEEDAAVKVVIIPEGLSERVIEVPAGSGNYRSLSANGSRLFWLDRATTREGKETLRTIEISKEEPEAADVLADVDGYELAGNGEKLLLRKGDGLYVVAAAPDAKLDDAAVDLAGWTIDLDPKLEWRQMFLDAWRMERDWFYDPGLHGADWDAVRDRYLPLVDRITTRDEFNDLLYQMVGELTASHTYVFGGDDREAPDQIDVASLGARLVRDDDGWLVQRVYRSDPDHPDELAPLARYGVNVREGDRIVAINGARGVAPAAALRNQAGRQVRLTVRPAGQRDERDVIVEPLTAAAARDLRYRDWEYGNRLRVDELSDGQLGYVHLRAMGAGDWTAFAREFYPAFRRGGVILDVRHNGGGNIESWLLSRLLRRDWMYWQGRAGEPSWNMQWAYRGHLVVICDEFTVSDGEVFVEGFRRLGLGDVIGNRTYGGEIWLSFGNRLRDSGLASAAEFGVFGPEGWLIENEGVEPDLPVDNLPRATAAGSDAQLETAVRHLLDRLAAEPVEDVVAPPYPKRAR